MEQSQTLLIEEELSKSLPNAANMNDSLMSKNVVTYFSHNLDSRFHSLSCNIDLTKCLIYESTSHERLVNQ